MVFSYESKFNIVGFVGHQWYWKRCGETLSNGVVSKSVKHGGGREHLGLGIALGELTIIERKINNKHYHNILHDILSMVLVKFGKEKRGLGVPI